MLLIKLKIETVRPIYRRKLNCENGATVHRKSVCDWCNSHSVVIV